MSDGSFVYPNDDNVKAVLFHTFINNSLEKKYLVGFKFTDREPIQMNFDNPAKPKTIFDYYEHLGWVKTMFANGTMMLSKQGIND